MTVKAAPPLLLNKASSNKVKVKLRIGGFVDVYSSSKQEWIEGKIEKIKGDLLCVVYGKHMKWLRKTSKQLRVRPDTIEEATVAAQQSENKKQNMQNHFQNPSEKYLPSTDAFEPQQQIQQQQFERYKIKFFFSVTHTHTHTHIKI